MVDLYQLEAPASGTPLWLDAVPEGRVRPAEKTDLPAHYQSGFVLKVPLVETPIYLPYLIDRFEAGGGEILNSEIKNLDKLLETYQCVINCSGLGSRELCQDSTLVPIQGHVVKLPRQSGLRHLADDSNLRELTYIFPRQSDCLLGGTAISGVDNLEPNPVEIQKILNRCLRLEPSLKDIEPLGIEVGIRPGMRRKSMNSARDSMPCPTLLIEDAVPVR